MPVLLPLVPHALDPLVLLPGGLRRRHLQEVQGRRPGEVGRLLQVLLHLVLFYYLCSLYCWVFQLLFKFPKLVIVLLIFDLLLLFRQRIEQEDVCNLLPCPVIGASHTIL